jgi:hypothetical protein
VKASAALILLAMARQLCGQPASERVINVKAFLLGSRFCRGDSEVAFSRNQVRLKFLNLSKAKRIAIAKSELHIDGIFVAETALAAKQGRFEAKLYLTPVQNQFHNISQWKEDLFLIVEPAKAAEMTTTFDLPIAVNAGTSPNGIIGSGQHYVVLNVSAWYDSTKSASNVQVALPTIGHLWTGSAQTEPIGIRVSSPVSIGWCP